MRDADRWPIRWDIRWRERGEKYKFADAIMSLDARSLSWPYFPFALISNWAPLTLCVCHYTTLAAAALFSFWLDVWEREYRKEVRGGSERRPPTAAHSRWYTTTAGEMSYAYTLSALVYKLENVTKFYTEPHSVTHLHSRSLFLLQKKN